MTTQFAFDSGQVLLTVALVAFGIAFLILANRWLLAKRMRNNLTAKYRNTDWKSPLEGRNKYPEVDVFRYSGGFMKVGMMASLLLVIALMGWTTYHKTVDVSQYTLQVEDDFTIEPPRTAEPPPPPPPPPPPVIEEVPDEVLLEEEDVTFLDQSVEAEDMVSESSLPEEPVADVPPPPPPPPPMEEPEEIFKVVEEMPRFPGCEDLDQDMAEKKACADKKLLEFIYSNIEYPSMARETNIQGNVVVSFVVNTDGSIEQLKVVRDIGAGCGNEVIRVLELMKQKNIKWLPGKQRGKPVRVQFLLPVKFILA